MNLAYEHPLYPRMDWQYDVANGDTILGYWEWVEHNKDVKISEYLEQQA